MAEPRVLPPHHEQLEEEQSKATERKALSAKTVHTALLQEGEEELARPSEALAWSGLAAGISMGLSLLVQGALRHHLPDTSWEKLVVSLGYPVGFIAVTLGRQQLYTETTLTAFLPFLHHKRADVFGNVVRLWLVVLIANMIGAALFGFTAAWTTTFAPELSREFVSIGERATQHGFATAFVKGIFGGWMIALMVWLMPSAEAARIWVIGIITYTLAVTELTHIIAGSIDVLFAVFSRQVAFATFLWSFFIPVLLGNTIGGVVFVAALNHAQVAAETS